MKLYFYYGVMGSSKTAIALMQKFGFEEHGKKVVLLKPIIDTRYGKTLVKSRIGLTCEALVIKQNEKICDALPKNNDFQIIIVDEAQFLITDQVDELRKLADSGKMVFCYGLRTNYMGKLFEGSKRLMEVSDTIREVQSMCSKCSKKAIISARHSNGKIIYEGSIIDIGGEEKYITLCHSCWKK